MLLPPFMQSISLIYPYYSLAVTENRDDYWGGGKWRLTNETHPARPGIRSPDPMHTITVTEGPTPCRQAISQLSTSLAIYN